MAWARTKMTLMDWEPQNDNDSPSQTNWDYFESRDQVGSKLRREFELARSIKKKGVRHIVSIWRLPSWLYSDPSKDVGSHRRRINPAKWPELLECIGSYLLHAKNKYGVEPDLFSFNEGNIGIYVLFSAEDHSDATRRIGAHLQKLGLGTKMLLGDVSIPQNTHMYIIPAIADQRALKYVGGLGFHSWFGATADHYAAWGSLAEVLKVPLFVAELGVDPNAWKTDVFKGADYALREARMYQGILLHARAQTLLFWEYTSDYGLVEEEWSPSDKKPTLVPTTRFWFVKQFSNLTPPNSSALGTTSTHSQVLFTAFGSSGETPGALSLHILNQAAARPATLLGLPKDLTALSMTTSSPTKAFVETGPLPVKDGKTGTEIAGTLVGDADDGGQGTGPLKRLFLRLGRDASPYPVSGEHRGRAKPPAEPSERSSRSFCFAGRPI